jgi:hypothetical protein
MNVLSTFAAVTHNGSVFVVSKGETADYWLGWLGLIRID